MKKWKLYLGLTVLFLAGVVIGAAGALTIVALQVKSIADRGPDAVPEIVMRRLDRRLDLDAGQHDAITIIVEDATDDMMHLRARVQPEREAIVDDALDQIYPLLDEEQQANLREDVDRVRARMRRFAEPRANANTAPPKAAPADGDSQAVAPNGEDLTD